MARAGHYDDGVLRRMTSASDRLLVAQLQLRGFVSRRIPTSAGAVHVLEAKGRGELPPLLVLHGFAGAAHFYDGVLLRMRPHVSRVIAPDLLGHGLSDMPQGGLDHACVGTALLEALDEAITWPVLVFGNSLGGAAALRFAMLRPEKVLGLFLVAPGGAPMEGEELRSFVSRFRLQNHRDALEFVDRLFDRPHPLRHALAVGTRHQFGKPGLRELIERISPENLLHPEELAKLTMPIQVVWGAADRILHASHLEFFRQHLPAHAKVQIVEHFGHTPHMDYPEELHRRLLAFVRDVVGPMPPKRGSRWAMLGLAARPAGAPDDED